MADISAFRGGVLPAVIGCPPFVVDQAVVDAIVQLCKDASIFEKSFEHWIDAENDVDSTDNDSITITLTDYVTATYRPHTIKELQIDGSGWNVFHKELSNNVDDLSLYQIDDTKFYNFPSTSTMKLFPIDDTATVEGDTFNFVDGDVSVAADTITETAHGLATGLPIRLSTTGTLPAGLATATTYYVIRVDADTIQLATTYANAVAGTNIDITAAAGAGTHTLTSRRTNVLYLDMAWLPLGTMTTVDDVVYNDHRMAVEEYAKYLLLRQPEKAWTDLALSARHMGEYARHMEDAKIRKIQGFAFGSPRIRSQRFF
jgi:hypothetical protein